MLKDSFISENGDRYTLETRDYGQVWWIYKNGSPQTESNEESHIRQKFQELKYLLGK
jgi:hypothetical protein